MVPRRLPGRQALWSLGLICLLALLAMGPAAFAADTAGDIGPTMRFVIVRSNDPGCEPICPEWISAEGSIEAGTPALFKRMLKTLGSRKLPVVVDSPGGNVEAALTLGRLIRKNKLDIAIGKTQFDGCLPDGTGCTENDGKGARYFGDAYAGGAMCNSACPLMFAGGVQRVVGEWAYLGVHQITTTYIRTKLQYRTTYRIVGGKKKVLNTKIVSRKNAGSYKTYEMSKAVEKRLAAYLDGMGVEQGVLETMKDTPASGIQQLDLESMLQTKLVTSPDSVDLLTAPTICSADPRPANCREIPVPAGKAARPANAEVAKAAPSSAASAKPETVRQDTVADMRFVVVRGRSFLCDPDCPEWISAEGKITAQTPEGLRQLLATLGDRRLPVVISSPGGDLSGALAAGRLIRERKLDVAVARTDFMECEPEKPGCTAEGGVYVGLTNDASGECDAACPIMLAGGVRRFVGPHAQLGLQSLQPEQAVKTYLEEMAVGPDLFAAIELHSSQPQLDPKVMLKVGLTTGPQSADELTGASICKSEPKPGNCREVSEPKIQANAPSKS
ncbi:hypothetical protein BPNPMPFG_000684 [Mesorhizobium sp. AR07]|uniref:COG3904 family protein n=1 Tax=Mesorhizobium sp. AR07 TaxID=2865838 RepID=UPI00215E0159|nr:hypothetical protein [Mesorhizobium sp. AR07]UVK45176.1 hypothetical protein BPNPMPFG_000684 [Mesorhizobium sp. AR07]